MVSLSFCAFPPRVPSFLFGFTENNISKKCLRYVVFGESNISGDLVICNRCRGPLWEQTLSPPVVLITVTTYS